MTSGPRRLCCNKSSWVDGSTIPCGHKLTMTGENPMGTNGNEFTGHHTGADRYSTGRSIPAALPSPWPIPISTVRNSLERALKRLRSVSSFILHTFRCLRDAVPQLTFARYVFEIGSSRSQSSNRNQSALPTARLSRKMFDPILSLSRQQLSYFHRTERLRIGSYRTDRFAIPLALPLQRQPDFYVFPLAAGEHENV